jgi:Ca-activated chloride channel family protein
MRTGLAVLCAGLMLATAAAARAWSPFRSENAEVNEGNALMAKQQYGPALAAYDEAAEKLPKEPGVQLNRGLALLGEGDGETAKEAFVAAAAPSSSAPLRAAAYYDLGLTFAREGDALSEQQEHETAIAQYREAADAFKRSLRIQPGNRDAAWNLEYALQRIREQEQEQEQQDQEQQDQEQQDQEQQDQEQQDQEQQDQEQQDQEQQDQQQQDQQQQDQQQQDQQQQDQQQQDQQQQDQQQQDQQQQDQQQQDQEQQDQQQQDQQQQDQQQQDQQQQQEQQDQQQQDQPNAAPEHVQRFLDALEQNEESLPLQRARQRSVGRRQPEKDW